MSQTDPSDHDLLVNLGASTQCLGQKIEAVLTRLDRLDRRILGNGEEGLEVRVTRMEDRWKSRIWMERTIIGVLIALVTTSIFTCLVGA